MTLPYSLEFFIFIFYNFHQKIVLHFQLSFFGNDFFFFHSFLIVNSSYSAILIASCSFFLFSVSVVKFPRSFINFFLSFFVLCCCFSLNLSPKYIFSDKSTFKVNVKQALFLFIFKVKKQKKIVTRIPRSG